MKHFLLLALTFLTLLNVNGRTTYSVLISQTQTPELTVTKDDQLAYTPQNLQVGDVITYNIIVTNTGNVTLNNIDVTDAYATISGSSIITTLDVGQSVTLNATHVVTQADIDAGQVVNSATASTTFNGLTISEISDDTDVSSPAGDHDPTVTFIIQYPELTVTKDDQLSYTPQNLQVGDVITYNISVTNTGNVTLSNITVSDNNATLIGANLIYNLAPGQSATVIATHTVTQADIDDGEVINSATASTTFNGLTISEISDDTDVSSPAGDHDPTITFIAQNPELTVTKDDQLPYTAQNLQVGDVISYNITVVNTGNVVLDLINIIDNNAAIVSGNPVVNLAPGSTAMLVAQHTVTQADIDAGEVINSATASTTFDGVSISDISDDTDINSPLGDDDPTVTRIAQYSQLTVYKDDNLPLNPTNLNVGDDITYSIVVTNTGNVTLNNINVNDGNAVINGSATIPVLTPGESAVITAVHQITQADMNQAYVDNQAMATGTDPNGIDVSDISDDPGTSTSNDVTHTDLSGSQGIGDILESKLLIYPNPAKDYVTIKNLSNYKVKQYSITDILGKKIVINHQITNHKIMISNLSPGTYFMQLQMDNNTFISKRIIKRN